MEERRVLLAIGLSLLVVIGYGYLFPGKPRPQSPVETAAGQPTVGTSSPEAAPSAPLVPRPTPPAPVNIQKPIADERETRVEVEGPSVSVAFTNRGARLLSWQLKGFKDKRGHAEELIQVVAGAPRALDIETGDPAVDERLQGALFEAQPERLDLVGEGELRFRYADGDLSAEKTLVFEADGLVKLRVSVRRGGQNLPVHVLWGPGIGNPSAGEMEVQGYEAPQGVAFIGSKVERLSASALDAPVARQGVSWGGIESRYFTALFLPPQEMNASWRRIERPGAEDVKKRRAVVAVLDLSGVQGDTLLYVGPKDYHELRKLGNGLERVVPVGDWIGPIVIPLIDLLRWVHGLVGNYGWAIILLTVMINVVMAPLRHFSIANGLKMSKMAPEMKVIQERYRKIPLMDPRRQEMQEEMGALYARHGMSMSSQMMVGCLPMLLTMPFLIAFYRVLSVSIDLRGAPFMWIPDLSQKDPYFLTPVLMGVSMFLMQRMTPTSLDPAQQRMMLLMPLVLSGMFLWAPGGLNLYWFASNLCAIIQQAVTLWILTRAAAGVPVRKEKRRR